MDDRLAALFDAEARRMAAYAERALARNNSLVYEAFEECRAILADAKDRVQQRTPALAEDT